MRDALFFAIFAIGFLWTLRQPWIGVMLWTWLSLMNPHSQWAYAAASWPLAHAIALAILVGMVFTKDRQSPMLGAGPALLAALVVWTTVGLLFSFNIGESYPLWVRSMKVWLMIFVMMALVTTRQRLHLLIALTVFSVAFYGVKGGVFTIVTAGSYRVWGPGGFIGGNNEIGLSLLMILPLMRYLQLQMTSYWQRYAMTAAMLLTAVTVLGTYSRGAFLGAAAVALFLIAKSRNKVTLGVAVAIAAAALLPIMPDAWWDRMGTIQNYSQDSSATGRMNAWANNWNLAKDRFFGGGFMIYKPEIFARYAPEPDRVHAAHSIYFQMLGEHGFIGLVLFLGIFVATWVVARDLIRLGSAAADVAWARDLGLMIQVSLIGYAVPGAFLSLAYYDLPYYVMAIAYLARRFASDAIGSTQNNAKAKAPAPVFIPQVRR